jgi:hypothetical protein
MKAFDKSGSSVSAMRTEGSDFFVGLDLKLGFYIFMVMNKAI